MHTHIKAVISKLTFGSLLFITVIAASAQTPASITGEKETPALVKYIGAQDDMFVFSVSYQNPNGTPFSVIVKDQEGTQLYQSSFREKDFSRQFRLPRTEKHGKLVFIFRDVKGNDIARTFEFNVSNRYVDEVAVKKLK